MKRTPARAWQLRCVLVYNRVDHLAIVRTENGRVPVPFVFRRRGDGCYLADPTLADFVLGGWQERKP